jgi:hypothetical protein
MNEGKEAHDKLKTHRMRVAKKKAVKQYKDTLNKPGNMRNNEFAFNRNEEARGRWLKANNYDFNSYSDYMRGFEA